VTRNDFNPREHDVPHLWSVDDHGRDGETWGGNLYHFARRIFRSSVESLRSTHPPLLRHATDPGAVGKIIRGPKIIVTSLRSCVIVLGKQRRLGDQGEVIRARRPRRLPVVLTQNEVKELLLRLTGDKWLRWRPSCTGRGYARVMPLEDIVSRDTVLGLLMGVTVGSISIWGNVVRDAPNSISVYPDLLSALVVPVIVYIVARRRGSAGADGPGLRRFGRHVGLVAGVVFAVFLIVFSASRFSTDAFWFLAPAAALVAFLITAALAIAAAVSPRAGLIVPVQVYGELVGLRQDGTTWDKPRHP
jgi:hypothetical protein